MTMIVVYNKLLLYGIECAIDKETGIREDSMLVFLFSPDCNDSFTLLKRYTLTDNCAIPCSETPIVCFLFFFFLFLCYLFLF